MPRSNDVKGFLGAFAILTSPFTAFFALYLLFGRGNFPEPEPERQPSPPAAPEIIEDPAAIPLPPALFVPAPEEKPVEEVLALPPKLPPGCTSFQAESGGTGLGSTTGRGRRLSRALGYYNKPDAVFVKEIREFALRRDVLYCLKRLKSTISGEWNDGENTAKIDRTARSDEIFLTSVHETIHGMQEAQGSSFNEDELTLEARQEVSLANEAVAAVGEGVAAYELMLEGDGRAWNAYGQPFRSQMHAAFTACTRNKNSSRQDCLLKMAEKGWDEIFKDQFWLDF